MRKDDSQIGSPEIIYRDTNEDWGGDADPGNVGKTIIRAISAYL